MSQLEKMRRYVGVALGAVLLLGCASREHLSLNFGRQARAFYAQQRVHREASKETPKGLDSEEAAIVHHSYRTNMGGGAKRSSEPSSRVILLQDPDKK